MKKWQKIVMYIVIAGLSYWGVVRFRRVRREAADKRRAAARLRPLAPRQAVKSTDPDDQVVIREEHPSSLQDEKNLKNHTLWVNDGGQMEYYPFNGKSVEFLRPAGLLLGAQKILVKDAVEQVGAVATETRFPDADAEVLLVFVLPDDSANREYAVAVGDREGRDYTILTDQLFFYDDPHQLYSYWGPKVWQSIDSHTASIGMTQRQLQFALGQVSTPRADIMGDQSVEFDNQGKPKLVTFVNGKASAIRDESQ